MQLLKETHPKEIGGRNFQVGILPYGKAMPAYHKIGKILAVLSKDETIAQAGAGLFMVASTFVGALDEADIKFFVDLYGTVTTVELDATHTLPLNTEINRNNVFSGRLEDLFEWLDFATEVNFKVVAEKLSAAHAALEKAAEEKAAKAQPNS